MPLSNLIRTIYAGAAYNDNWQTTMAALEAEFSGYASAVVWATPSASMLTQTNVNQDVAADYNDRLWTKDLWMQKFSRATTGTVATGLELAGLDEFDAEYVNDILTKSDCSDGLCLKLRETRGTSAALSVYRRLNQEAFTSSDAEKMRALSPHLQQAMELTQRFGEMNHLMSSFEATLGDSNDIVFFISGDRKVAWQNDAADCYVRQAKRLQYERGLIRFCGRSAQEKFETALRQAKRVGGASFSVTGIDGSPPQLVCIRNMDGLSDPLTTPFSGGIRHSGRFILSIRGGKISVEHVVPYLIDAFALSNREAEICVLIGDGKTVSEIADHLRRSIDTIRTHVKRILSKMNFNRQSEIVGLLSALSR